MAHIAGGARLSINEAATPNSLGMSATMFPFADAALNDPVTGKKDGLLEKARAADTRPRSSTRTRRSMLGRRARRGAGALDAGRTRESTVA